MQSYSCEHTAYALRLYSKSTSQLTSRNYCTLHLPGGASRRQQIVNEWKRSSAVRGARSELYPSQQTADEITDSADDKLLDCVLRNNDHVLHELLSKRVNITLAYNLRTRCHDRTIPEKKGHLAEKNFSTRMLYKKCILILLLHLNFN